MKLIQANCRAQFTAEDIDFVLSVLGEKAGAGDTLVKLLTDVDTRDLILDDPALFQALIEGHACVRVSTRFYFYILIRQTLLRADIQDRGVADYVAELLTAFSRTERLRCVLPGGGLPMDYFFEMVAALDKADDHARFQLRMHIGNQSLFLAGMFPDRIRRRAERCGAPSVGYYEALGQASYRVASDHRLAQRFDLAPVLTTLADRFHETRQALNDAAERLLFLGDPVRPTGGVEGWG